MIDDTKEDIVGDMKNGMLPCPFCGNIDVTDEYSSVYGGIRQDQQDGYVACEKCGADGPVIIMDDITENDGKLVSAVKHAWNQRVVFQPVIPDNVSDEFRAGARALFDSVLYATANNWHADPKLQKICDRENYLINMAVIDALEYVDEHTHANWKQITGNI